MIPFSCAAPSASVICLAIPSASVTGMERWPFDRPVSGPRSIRAPARPRSRFLKAVDGADVRVIQRGQRSGFALKSRPPLRVRREGLRQDFDSDIASELRIARAIDLAHAAYAQLEPPPRTGRGVRRPSAAVAWRPAVFLRRSLRCRERGAGRRPPRADRGGRRSVPPGRRRGRPARTRGPREKPLPDQTKGERSRRSLAIQIAGAATHSRPPTDASPSPAIGPSPRRFPRSSIHRRTATPPVGPGRGRGPSGASVPHPGR